MGLTFYTKTVSLSFYKFDTENVTNLIYNIPNYKYTPK